jgi:hypothetical protein
MSTFILIFIIFAVKNEFSLNDSSFHKFAITEFSDQNLTILTTDDSSETIEFAIFKLTFDELAILKQSADSV